jgi:hypothetical protein
MKPHEMLAVLLRAVGIISVINGPLGFLSLAPGPIILSLYQVVMGVILTKFADSIARWFYRKNLSESVD